MSYKSKDYEIEISPGYYQLKDEVSFSTIFPTYIIAYCPDTNSWFVINQRFFYYEYDKEFNAEQEGINYFKENINTFLGLTKDMSEQSNIYFENTKEFLGE